TTWRIEDTYDLFEASYDFSGAGLDVTHTRRIVFVRPRLWVMTDTLSGEGLRTIERNFQCAAGCEVEAGESTHTLVAANGARLQLFDFGPELSAEVVEGQTEYPGSTIGGGQINSWINGGRGWSSRVFDRDFRPDRNSTAPAPALVVSGEVELPTSIVSVMVPTRPEEPAVTDCRWDGETLEVRRADATNLLVRFRDGVPVSASTD
ncbi:MAG: hypothetical protein GF393_01780, partial [Armatimonadia bacterium]|nr:hypothetical protein [Armatimonadia bacterium]